MKGGGNHREDGGFVGWLGKGEESSAVGRETWLEEGEVELNDMAWVVAHDRGFAHTEEEEKMMGLV